MPRAPKAGLSGIKEQTLIVDNGAYTIKAGFANAEPDVSDCHIIPNCIVRDSDRRVWVGSQLEQCKDYRELAFRRPVDKGYLVNWESEKAIWGHSFFSQNSELKCDPHETNLVLTEAPNCPQALQLNCDQIVFEEFEFASYYRSLGPAFNAYNDIPQILDSTAMAGGPPILPVECLLVVDSGYSHTTVTPLINGRPVQQAIRRLDIGGKIMTNFLKEQLSIRSINLMDETYAVDEMKRATSFVSSNFRADLESTWKNRERDLSVVVDYVLPDYQITHHGVVRPHDIQASKTTQKASKGPLRETVVTLTNERFTGPELLFSPTDVGLQEASLPSIILESVEALPSSIRPAMLANMVVIGGNANLPGLVERLGQELRQLAPSDCTVRLAAPPDPIRATWLGAARMASNRNVLKRLAVTRAEYEEHGSNWVLRKFTSQGLVH